MKKVCLFACTVLVAMVALLGCGPSTADLASGFKSSMEQKLAKAGIRVDSVTLVHQGGNNYTGIAKLSKGSETEEVSLKVVCDNENFQWEIVTK